MLFRSIDVLHELILLEVPGAGPVEGNLQALLDILYADDVALIAYHSHELAQQLLNCLDVFCAIFKMQVNQHESKTDMCRCLSTRRSEDTTRGCVMV